jgi:ribosomal protein S18 acetylase RimI-like enzyme
VSAIDHTRPFTIRRARSEDAQAIADLVREAFTTEIPAYDENLPPLRETAATVEDAMARGVVLVAEQRGRVVGSVRGELDEHRTCMVGRLVVLPEYRRSGIARALTVELETLFPDAQRFELFTGHLSTGPLALYESLGYRRFREERVSPTTVLVYLEKSEGG